MKNTTAVTAEPNSLEIVLTREFEAPPAQVYRAFTEPDLMVQWMAPWDVSMKIETFEPRPGGLYHYRFSRPGMEMGFHGVFHDCIAPEVMIYTSEFDDLPVKGHACLETVRFEELPNNRTRVIIQDVFQYLTDRDMALKSGMDKGVSASHDKLDALLETLSAH